MINYRFEVEDATGNITTRGVDMGGEVTLVHLNRQQGLITVKIAGGMHWSGQGQQSYAPARYVTYEYMEETPPREGVGKQGITAFHVNSTARVDIPVRAKPLVIKR